MIRVAAAVAVCLTLILAFRSFAAVQTKLPVSDPQALAFAAQSIVALTGGNPVADVALTGNATWIAGSDTETGSVTLQAKGTSESRIDLTLTNGLRTDIRNDTASTPQGESIASDGILHPWALHNCWINSSWFFPALSFLSAASDPTIIFSYIGQEVRGGESVQHIQVYRYLTGQKPTPIALTQQLSTTDLYLDSATLLPAAITFNTHPDDDGGTNIAIEIDFSNYQAINGIAVPMHIQKLIFNGLALDIVVTGAVFNSGLPDTLFATQ